MNSVATIIPVHTYNDLVINAISSAVNQDYVKNRVYVVLNTTEKNLQEKLEKQFKERIEIISINQIGVSYARNAGIKNSESKYIAFLDSDDIWMKDKLSLQIDFMKKNNYLISGSLMRYVTNKVVSNHYVGAYKLDQENIRKAKRMPFPISSLIIERTVLDNQELFSENLGTKDYGQVEDIEFISRLAFKYEIGTFLNCTGEYFINPDGATQKEFIKQRSASDKLSSLRTTGFDGFINEFDYKILLNNKIYSELYGYRFMVSYVSKKYFMSIFYITLAFVLNPVSILKKIARR